MARLFDDAQYEYLQWTGASPPVTGPPFTLACWGRSDSDSATQTLIWLGDKDASGAVIGALQMAGAADGDPVRAVTGDNGLAFASSTTGYVANTWHHVCGVFATTSDRRVYLDGGGKGTDGTNKAPSGTDCAAIGRFAASAPGDYLSGAVAEAAVWNAALDDDDVRALAGRYCPLLIRRDRLVAYWPLGGFSRPDDRDLLGGYGMTAYNTPSWTDHPPTLHPVQPSRAVIHGVQPTQVPWHLFMGRAA